MNALAIGMPVAHRLGYQGSGYRLLGPTFLKLGMPVLLIDDVFLPDPDLGLNPFSADMPSEMSKVRLHQRGDESWVFVDREHVPRVRLPFTLISPSDTRCWLVVCDTFWTEQSCTYLWRGRVGVAQLLPT